jgi:hypothetical protein
VGEEERRGRGILEGEEERMYSAGGGGGGGDKARPVRQGERQRGMFWFWRASMTPEDRWKGGTMVAMRPLPAIFSLPEEMFMRCKRGLNCFS